MRHICAFGGDCNCTIVKDGCVQAPGTSCFELSCSWCKDSHFGTRVPDVAERPAFRYAHPVEGQNTTSFHVGGLDSTVDVVLVGRKTIDDVIGALKDALLCADAKKNEPKENYPKIQDTYPGLPTLDDPVIRSNISTQKFRCPDCLHAWHNEGCQTAEEHNWTAEARRCTCARRVSVNEYLRAGCPR
jgi:hypothetical protein